jgi:hypothetical protein
VLQVPPVAAVHTMTPSSPRSWKAGPLLTPAGTLPAEQRPPAYSEQAPSEGAFSGRQKAHFWVILLPGNYTGKKMAVPFLASQVLAM